MNDTLTDPIPYRDFNPVCDCEECAERKARYKPTFLAHETHPSDSYQYAVTVDTEWGRIVYHCQECFDKGTWAHA